MLTAQEIIHLPINAKIPGFEYNTPERQYFSQDWGNDVVTNVKEPTIEIYTTPDSINTGIGVVVAPGGGLFALSIESEGRMVAKWLSERGITAFVLSYRVMPTSDDGVRQVQEGKVPNFYGVARKTLPYSISDGLEAIKYMRENADAYGIMPEKIGMIGFSAGGAVTMGVAYQGKDKSKLNFITPVYAWTTVFDALPPPEGAGPILVICASDDPIDLAAGNLDIYKKWLDAKNSAALHMYSKGGHGFGMKTNNLPSDRWIERFYEWLIAEGFIED